MANNNGKVYVGAEISRTLYDKIEQYRASQSPIPTIADVLRRALEEFLKEASA